MKAKSKRKGNFPPLRFPEFKAEWKRKKLGEVMDFKVTNSYSREKLNYEKGTVKNIHYGDIHTKFRTLFNITNEIVPYINEEINIEKIAKDNYCQEGDVIFADASEDLNDVGKCIEIVKLNSEKLLSGLHTLLARPKRNIFFVGFNGYLFKSNFVRSQIQKEAQGIKVSSISAKRISNTELFYPTHQEQTKIASFLSLIDERIQTQMKIIEEWEKLKKGMIDELFLQKLILKEFDNEWEEISIGAIGTVVTGGTPSKKESKFWGGDFAWVTAQDFTEKYIYNSVLKLTDKGKKKSRTIPRNSVLVTCIASIGLNGINKVECAINQQINAIICNPLNYYEFIYYAILANTERLKNLAGQTAVPIINKSVFEKFTISKPKSLKEQQKIASILSSFDKKLKIERQILTQYQNQKKYLLQNMFI